MSLLTLVSVIGVVALVFTAIIKMRTQKVNNFILSLLQNFCGFLFLFSGWVKVVDPMGTAFKMEQYFAEFESVFSGAGWQGLAAFFPWLSGYSLSFSVFMIVLEMILGLFLVFGVLPKLTSWLFFLIIVFFTFLTGFTYLTGYVPQDVNFFEFSKWGDFVKTNMKVTDCGCFGDFIKLEPKTSFLKDVFLLIPSILFLLFNRRFHVLIRPKAQMMLSVASTFFLIVYALYNFYWNEPHVDFRPFKEGANIREIKAAEKEAMENVDVTIVMKSKTDGQIVKLPYDQWMKEFKTYPKEEWEYLEQEKSEPVVPQTKISEFMVESMDGDEVGDAILEYEDYQFIIICHKFKGEQKVNTVIVQDSVFRQDTVMGEDGKPLVVETLDRIDEREDVAFSFAWDESYLNTMINKIKPLVQSASEDSIRTIGIVGSSSNEAIADMLKTTEMEMEFFKADDILLKTIQRSNPGVLLMKDGVVIRKWHIRQLPDYENIKSRFLSQ
jgi:uncharacterized membrane protein YphA (DoxX/SURF4 family)